MLLKVHVMIFHLITAGIILAFFKRCSVLVIEKFDIPMDLTSPISTHSSILYRRRKKWDCKYLRSNVPPNIFWCSLHYSQACPHQCIVKAASHSKTIPNSNSSSLQASRIDFYLLLVANGVSKGPGSLVANLSRRVCKHWSLLQDTSLCT